MHNKDKTFPFPPPPVHKVLQPRVSRWNTVEHAREVAALTTRVRELEDLVVKIAKGSGGQR